MDPLRGVPRFFFRMSITYPIRKCIALIKNRTASWGLLSDLSLNVSPSFSRYNKVFYPPSCLFCPRGRIKFCRGGAEKKGCRKFFAPPYQFFAPPYQFFAPPAGGANFYRGVLTINPQTYKQRAYLLLYIIFWRC